MGRGAVPLLCVMAFVHMHTCMSFGGKTKLMNVLHISLSLFSGVCTSFCSLLLFLFVPFFFFSFLHSFLLPLRLLSRAFGANTAPVAAERCLLSLLLFALLLCRNGLGAEDRLVVDGFVRVCVFARTCVCVYFYFFVCVCVSTSVSLCRCKLLKLAPFAVPVSTRSTHAHSLTHTLNHTRLLLCFPSVSLHQKNRIPQS